MNDLLHYRFTKLNIDTGEGPLKPQWNRTVCPKCQEEKNTKHKNLAFNMTDGRYVCHKCGWKGNAIYQTKVEYTKPVWNDAPPSDKVKEYFLSRGISVSTFNKLVKEKIISYSKKGEGFFFNYWLGDEYINYKARAIADKAFYQQKDGQKVLFNINSAKGKTRGIIVEGEMSVIACIEAGLDRDYALLSLENGASKEGSVDGKFAGLKNCYEYINHIEEWTIALDNDQAGVYTGNELIKYLGEHRCKIIEYPEKCKDPDDIINRQKRPAFTSSENNEVLKNMMTSAVDYPVKGIIILDDKLKALLMQYKLHGRPKAIKVPMMDGHFSFKRGDLTVISGYANQGKALAIDTPIPTKEGWKNMEFIQVGDIVFDEDGKLCNVTAVTEIQYGRTCYELTFSDGSLIVCDEEHLWKTSTPQARASKKRQEKRSTKETTNDQRHKCLTPTILTTKEIINSFYTQHGATTRPNHSIDLCKPIILDKANLPIPGYVLGIWLGDGDTAGGRITTASQDVLDNIKNEGYLINKNKAQYRYGVMGLQRQLRECGLIGKKRIPAIYFRSSIEQRMELLNGLMDSDGYIGLDGMCEFCVIKKDLALDVYELITSLGVKATFNEGDAKLNGKFISKRYRISFKPSSNVFKIKKNMQRHKDGVKCSYRYIKSYKKVDSVPVKCISVDSPNKMYLCTKSFIPTHNTTFAMNLAYLMIMEYQWKWVIFAGEQNPQDRYFEDLAQMILRKPIEDKDRMGNPIDGCATPEEYEAALEFISNHVYLVYPERGQKPTLEWIMEKVDFLKHKHGINGVILDTFNKMKHDFGNQRDDVYLDDWLDKCLEYAHSYDGFMLLMHPSKPSTLKNGQVPMMNMYGIAGGAMTPNKVDNIIIYHRPTRFAEGGLPNNEAIIKFEKIRDTKAVGRLGEYPVIYDPFKNGFKYGPSGFSYNRTIDYATSEIIKSIPDENYIDVDDIPF